MNIDDKNLWEKIRAATAGALLSVEEKLVKSQGELPFRCVI